MSGAAVHFTRRSIKSRVVFGHPFPKVIDRWDARIMGCLGAEG